MPASLKRIPIRRYLERFDDWERASPIVRWDVMKSARKLGEWVSLQETETGEPGVLIGPSYPECRSDAWVIVSDPGARSARSARVTPERQRSGRGRAAA